MGQTLEPKPLQPTVERNALHCQPLTGKKAIERFPSAAFQGVKSMRLAHEASSG
ncbi:hypothetical protein Q31b_16380 [Novipirellula aureliae]|uniref:Uncharacterized protein n=1 Tax=Novipirellula aureliae TaxID=2527966 RepID=A0A5C6E371_9BACT|nr:hypothetical protein Q31b_16380 [Novipirellula aureliae]